MSLLVAAAKGLDRAPVMVGVFERSSSLLCGGLPVCECLALVVQSLWKLPTHAGWRLAIIGFVWLTLSIKLSFGRGMGPFFLVAAAKEFDRAPVIVGVC